jgi:flavin reductase (DIM6/NTAB) family NADH-FMN oxidoreductase RutF
MRIPVELRRSFRLLNHGPSTLVTTAAGGRRNVMSAAWVMPIDFEPPRLAAVIAAGTFTRELVEASGEFVVAVPSARQASIAWSVGSTSGRDVDKFEALGLATAAASRVAAPLVEGCLAWLECRVLPEPALAERYDLFLAEVVAAWADDAAFDGREWNFPDEDTRSIHHLARGVFFATGRRIDAKEP